MDTGEFQKLYSLEETHWWCVGLRELVHSAIQDTFLRTSARVLDAGCGTGALLRSLNLPGLVFGLDLSPLALEFCQARGLPNLLQASTSQLPVPDGKLDCVLSLDVLYHEWVERDSSALEEYHRALKPGGYLLLQLPAYRFLYSSHDRAIGTARRYTLSEVHRKVAAADFRIDRLTYRNTLLFPAILLIRLLRKLFSSESSDLRPHAPIPNAFYLDLIRAENRLILSKFRLPFGSSILCIATRS